MNWWGRLLPLGAFALVLGLLLAALVTEQKPFSALTGQRLPELCLPTVEAPQAGCRSTASLSGQAMLCAGCLVEHPLLMEMAQRQGVAIVGLNYKDEPDHARQWLGRHGSPYQFSLMDYQGGLALRMGVTGAPETYVLDAQGVVRHRHVGVMDRRTWEQELAPLLSSLYPQWQNFR